LPQSATVSTANWICPPVFAVVGLAYAAAAMESVLLAAERIGAMVVAAQVVAGVVVAVAVAAEFVVAAIVAVVVAVQVVAEAVVVVVTAEQAQQGTQAEHFHNSRTVLRQGD